MRRFFALFVLLFGLFIKPAECYQPNPYQVKAALLYNFAKYIRFPEDSYNERNKLVFGVLGDDPFGDILDKLIAGKTIGGKGIEILRFSKVKDIKKTNVLFINLPLSDFKDSDQSIINLSSLTVSDVEGFVEAGGVINFIDQPGRVSFEVNKGAASRAGLEISSALLRLADRVVE